MIDICMVVFKNYDIARLNLEYMNRLEGDYRVLVVDNEKPHLRNHQAFELLAAVNPNVVLLDYENYPQREWDGESHGAALDALISNTETAIVGTMDTDFFWTDPNILTHVWSAFDIGIQAVGCAGWYPDWQAALDPRHPDRAGHMAPVVWGQFLSRELAQSETFVSTMEESGRVMETGWRIRKKIIDEGILCEVFPGFKYPKQLDSEACFFGTEEKPEGIHFLKGTSRLNTDAYIYRNMVEVSFARWQR